MESFCFGKKAARLDFMESEASCVYMYVEAVVTWFSTAGVRLKVIGILLEE